MQTQILDTSQDSLAQAIKVLKNSGLVAFPTETVYGLGAHGLDPIGVARIFEAKGRPQDNPLILHIARIDVIEKYAKDIRPYVYRLAEEYSPGPITFVLEKRDIVPDIVTAGLPTVCLRIPSHPVALDLIEALGAPIAAPSANTSGRPSPTSADHVYEDLHGKIDLIIDGGSTDIGIESTVVDCTGEAPIILREGAVTREMIESTLGLTLSSKPGEKSRSPGTRYRHYAPDLPIELVDQSQRVALIDRMNVRSDEAFLYFDPIVGNVILPNIYRFHRLEDFSRELFSLFRTLEKSGCKKLYIERLPLSGLGIALMNRIEKAAGR